jgi:hypothetical protein
MRRSFLTTLLALAALLATAGSSQARTSQSAFDVLVEPTVTASSNGFTIQIQMQGTFDASSKTAAGDGTLALMQGGSVVETASFSLERLVAFQLYGCGQIDDVTLPDDYCGGRAIFAALAVNSAGVPKQILVEVDCQIHDPGGQTPPGTSEGVKVNIRAINFNKHVTGDNLFIRS